MKMHRRVSALSIVVIFVLAMSILGAMLIAIPDEISICDTGVEGVQLELRRSRIFGRARALVLVEVDSDSIPGLPSIVDIGSKDEAEILGLALAKPGGPPIDVFSREFAKEHCSLRP